MIRGDKAFVDAHVKDDVDVDKQSHHHTLGPGPFQAAPGNHTHPNSGGGPTLYPFNEQVTLDGTGDFLVSLGFEPYQGIILVFVNGIRQTPFDDYEVDGTDFTLFEHMNTDDDELGLYYWYEVVE